jgi:DNA-binding SARP family transcriptional activator
MDFHILGPLEVRDEGRVVALGGSRQRALLALMLLHANETLSTDRLIDELWGGEAPDGARRTVHVQISRLRKALTPADGRAAGGAVVVTREHGYELTLDLERLDAHRFERLVTDGERDLEASRPEHAGDELQRALALWRGAPLGGVEYERFAQPEVRRLSELRWRALELQIETDLALGRHADVVGRLPALIREQPHSERLRAQLMLALYRCDRQAEALQAYQDARRDLVQGLGIEPGRRLRELESAILAQDPALSPAPPAPLPEPPPPEAPAAPVGRARRLVTVVVSNLAGPAALDLEAMHSALTRRAAICSKVIERHGGTVEPFAGHSVVGTFGLRSLHEDDALRAVRAALELRAGCADGVTAGINSGDVFVGAGSRGETLAMGDLLNVAAKLEAAAGDGEIVLGELTHRLVARHVRVEPLEPLVLRGREDGVPAFRLVELRAEDRPAASPLIGRERERATLHDLLAVVVRERTCRQVTVDGAPGIGKSRLALELFRDVSGEATVVVGRCLSYGDGITFRPLADIVHQLTGGDLEPGIARLLRGEAEADSIARRVLGAIGTPGESTPAVETFWAFRRLLEAAARERPLVAIVDDVHWAEPMLLELLESVVAFSSGSPILLVCLARPELVQVRPAWAALEPSGSRLQLEPLSAAEAKEFVDTLAGGELDADAAGLIVERAEGNPLFLEQLVAVRAGQDAADLPDTIEAVLAARIEHLEPDERAVLVHASVEGRNFHRAAVAELMSSDAPHAIAAPLMGLVRKQLVRPDRPEFGGDDVFRFAHALIREVAYSGMPKRLRADLHERLAGWLKLRARARDEAVGYHLESAVRYRRQIGAEAAGDRELAAEAAALLGTAAHAALARSDPKAGSRLLERAVSVLAPEDPARPELLSALCTALVDAGRLADAAAYLSEAIERIGDPRLQSHALVDQQLARLHAGTSGGHDEARRVADVAIAHLERHGDDLGQCRAWRLRAWVDWIECRSARADEAWQRAAVHARRAGDDRELFEILGWRASAAVLGPMPVDAAIERCEDFRAQVGSSPLAVASTLRPLALLRAMTGEFEVARRLIREANELRDELGDNRMESVVSHHESLVEMLAERPDEAERRLRAGYEKLHAMDERDLRATTLAYLASAVLAQDRPGEAEELCRQSEEIADAEDIATQVVWRGALARIRARRGEVEEALALAREAVDLTEPTDLLVQRGDALLDLAEVLGLTDRRAEADACARQALELFEQKGNLVSAARARTRLEAANGSATKVTTVRQP